MPDAAPDLSTDCLTSGDIARSLNVDLKTVHRWVRRGRLRGQRTKGGHLRFRRVEVIRFLRLRHANIPESIRVECPRVLVVGVTSPAEPGSLGSCVRGLYDALLELATSAYDVVAVDIDGVDIEQATGFVAAVRRHPCTEQLALIGVSRWPDRRHAVVAVGADLAVSTTQQLTAAISFITGAALDPHEAVTASPATAAGAAVRALPEQEPSPCASSATRALAG